MGVVSDEMRPRPVTSDIQHNQQVTSWNELNTAGDLLSHIIQTKDVIKTNEGQLNYRRRWADDVMGDRPTSVGMHNLLVCHWI